MSQRSCCVWLVLLVTFGSCGSPETTVEYYVVGGYEFSRAERRSIETVAAATAAEVRQLLPALPRQLEIEVQPSKNAIPETGQAAGVRQPNIVLWTVDPSRTGGVAATVHRQLRPTLFHEFHHLVRGSTLQATTLMDHVIAEGMATAFERDFTGAPTPWGEYPVEVSDWVKELMALPPTTGWDHSMMIRHPDERRWVGMRAGTYLVDRAMKASGKSAAELVSMTTEDVIRLALRQ
jgi:uncharacterized protein YjaZ